MRLFSPPFKARLLILAAILLGLLFTGLFKLYHAAPNASAQSTEIWIGLDARFAARCISRIWSKRREGGPRALVCNILTRCYQTNAAGQLVCVNFFTYLQLLRAHPCLTEGGSLLNTPLNTPKCSVRVFRVFMNTPPEYSEYSDYSTEYSA